MDPMRSMPGSQTIHSSSNPTAIDTTASPSVAAFAVTTDDADQVLANPALPVDQGSSSSAPVEQSHATMYPYDQPSSMTPPSPQPDPQSSSSTPTSQEKLSKEDAKPSAQSDDAHPRKRTRATPEQLLVLEKTFSISPSPTNRVREQLSRQLGMSERSIQIWFQNRRAKVKNLAKRSSLLHEDTVRMQQQAASAAIAACHAATGHQRIAPDGSVVIDPDLYCYYYYFYYNHQQQQRQQGKLQGPSTHWHSSDINMTGSGTSSVPPPPMALQPMSLPPPPPPPPPPMNQLRELGAYRQAWDVPVTPLPSSIAPPLSSSTSDSVRQQFTGTPHHYGNSEPYVNRLRAHSVGPYPQYYQTHHGYSRERQSSFEVAAMHQNVYRGRSNTLPAAPQPGYWMANRAMVNQGAYPVPSHPNVAPQQLPVHGTMPPPATPMWVPYGMASVMPSEERVGTPMSMDGTLEGDNINLLVPTRISIEALQIGTWKRISMEPSDLICHYDVQRSVMIWEIKDGHQRFKMEFAMDMIHELRLGPLQERLGWARLQLRLSQPEAISFYMEDPKTGWTQCQDFTQDHQATRVAIHQLDGPALALRAELHRLAQNNAHIHSLVWQQDTQAIDPRFLSTPFGQVRDATPADVVMTLPQGDDASMLSLLNLQKDPINNDTTTASEEHM